MKKVLLIGLGNKNPKNQFILKQLKKMNLDFYFLKSYQDENWFTDIIDKNHIFLTDVYNPTRAISDLSVIIQKNNLKFDAIFTFDEHLVLQTSVIAQFFGCIATPIETISASSANKLTFRNKYNKICNKNLIKSAIEIIDNIEENTILSDKDLVIKPLFGNNSYGVKKIYAGKSNNIKQYVNQSWSTKQEESYKNFNGVFLLEEYIKGTTFSVDGIVQNNVVLFAGINQFGYSPEPYFFQVSNTIPPVLDKIQQEKIYKTISHSLKELKYNNTPFHAEIKYTDKKIYIIEIACRAPGGQIMKGYEQAYGYNFVKQVINLYLGKPVSFIKKKNNHVLQKGVYIPQNCSIKDFYIPEQTPKCKEFVRILNKGDKNSYPISATPVYYYALTERNKDKIYVKSHKIENDIKITIS